VNKKDASSKKSVHKFVNIELIVYLCPRNNERSMIVTFEEDYLRELYEDGQASDKKHRFQPQIIKKYTRVVDLMMAEPNVMGLTKYGDCTTNICTETKRDYRR
jgi:hypothetical protein